MHVKYNLFIEETTVKQKSVPMKNEFNFTFSVINCSYVYTENMIIDSKYKLMWQKIYKKKLSLLIRYRRSWIN